MARRYHVVYPRTLQRAYAGNVSRLQYAFERVYDWLIQSPKAKPDVVQVMKTFATASGLDLNDAQPATQFRITSGVKYAMPATTGTYVNGYTFTVVGGVVTAIVAS